MSVLVYLKSRNATQFPRREYLFLTISLIRCIPFKLQVFIRRLMLADDIRFYA